MNCVGAVTGVFILFQLFIQDLYLVPGIQIDQDVTSTTLYMGFGLFFWLIHSVDTERGSFRIYKIRMTKGR